MLVMIQFTVYEREPYVDKSTANVKPARAGRMMDEKRILSMKSVDCLFDLFRVQLNEKERGVFTA